MLELTGGEMKGIALLVAAGLALAACGSPAHQAATGAPDDPVSSSPDRPPPGDVATIPPTDQCGLGAEVSDDASGGDALQHERCPANGDYKKKYVLVEPRPGMVEVHPIPWTGAQTSEDGRTLIVRFWSGVAPCSVLDHIDVDYQEKSVVVTLFEGRKPATGDVACIEIAELKAVRVELSERVGDRNVVDGTKKA